jgi:hypothetical protein
MTNRVLIVAFAGLTVVAVAQSDGTQKSASTPSQPTTAQPAEQRMHKPMKATAEVSTTPPLVNGKEVSKTSAADDWQAPKAKTSSPKPAEPSSTAPKAPAQATVKNTSATSNADVVAPRDIATGQSSGKRMHKPVTVTAESGAKTASTPEKK